MRINKIHFHFNACYKLKIVICINIMCYFQRASEMNPSLSPSRKTRNHATIVTEAMRKARTQLDLAVQVATAHDEDLKARLEEIRDLLVKEIREVGSGVCNGR
jgi:hypothetical protein